MLRFWFAGLVLAVCVCAAPRPFPQQASDLKADASVRFGSLPNGLRYAIKSNPEPRGRAAFRLLVDAGSLMETEPQRGIAHFLEHMSFNGSEHYAPGTLIEFFQRMGMTFGGDTNAYTSFDHTVYQIDLPETRSETLEEGLKVLSDYAGGLLLLPAEIDRERGIILAEKRARDSVQSRTIEAEYGFAYAGTRIPGRFPIGVSETISSVGKADFVDFYDTWYRPERLTLVLVGDFDAQLLEARVRDLFAAKTARAPARDVAAFGVPEEAGLPKIGFHAEREAPFTRVTLRCQRAYAPRILGRSDLLARQPEGLAVAMFNQRMSELAKKEGAPFMSASMSIGEPFDIMREAAVRISCKPEQWKDAVAVAEQELRRVLTHGFLDAEFKVAVANERNSLEQAVKTASTRRSSEWADQLVDVLQANQVFTSNDDDLALLGPALEKLSPAACAQALSKLWEGGTRSLFIAGNCEIPGDAVAQIREVLNKSAVVAVQAPAAQAELVWAYADFGKAGETVEKVEVADLGILQTRFPNGVRLNIKKTDFQAGELSVRVRIAGGSLLEPVERPGLATFASNFLFMGGLGRHGIDDLQKILAGRNVMPGFSVGDDHLLLSGETTPEDLSLQLQLFAALVTDPGYRPESARQFAKAIDQFYNRLERTVEGRLQLEAPRAMANGDTRFGLPSRDAMARLTLDEMRAWLTPQLTTGAVEISIVGDLDVEKTIAAVSGTFGALPARGAGAPAEDLRKVGIPPLPFSRIIEVDTKIDKALLFLEWPTYTDTRDYRRCRRLNLLADVFTDRLRVKIREELGESYSPDVSLSSSSGYRNRGFIDAYLLVDPAKAAVIEEAVLTISEALRTGGITEDELKRARLPLLTAIRESSRSNAYWIGAVLEHCQGEPRLLEAARNRSSDIEAITVDELNALAKEYLGRDKAYRWLSKRKTAGDAASPVAK